MAIGSFAWSVILPLAGVTLNDNPSYERGSTGAAAIQGATLGTAANKQQFGAWSLSVAPSSNGTSGAYLGTATAGNGTSYMYSAYVNGAAGVNYMLAVADTSNALLGSVLFTGGGTWHRYVGSYTEASGANRRVIVRKNGDASQGTYYVDGWNFTPGTAFQSYIDGDQEGCIWVGAVHASQSFRDGQSRAGGSVVSLADLGFTVADQPGIGMPPVENSFQSYAVVPGAEFQRQRAGVRTFTLTSYVSGTSRADLHVTRATIINALKIDAVTPQQPCRFLYTGGLGTVQIDAVYDAGLEYGKPKGFTEEVITRFIAGDPYWRTTTQEGTSLAPRASIGSTNYIAYRDPLGRWGTMGVAGTTLQPGAAGLVQVWTILPIDSGTVLVGGIFGSAGGTFVTGIARYNPSTNRWGTLQGGSFTASPGAPTIFTLLRAPFGSIYIGGDYVTIGGTTCKALCSWNGGYGTLIGGTIGGGYVQDLAYNGTLFFAGSIGGPIGGTATRHIGIHVNNAFGTLKNGTVSDIVDAIALDRQQQLITTGFFTSVAGTTANGVARHANGSWGTMGAGLANSVAGHALLIGQDARTYLGGQFLQAGGVDANGASVWNGIQWFPLGAGVQGPSSPGLFALMQDRRTTSIWGGGLFGTAGSVPVSDGLAVYNGYAWISPDVQIDPASGTIYALAQSQDGTTYIAGDFTGTARVAAVAEIVNTGRTSVQPIVTLWNTGSGTARLYQLVNTLTGDALYFNYTMLAGEQLTMDLDKRTFISDYRDSQFGRIVPGSNIASWKLAPGTNYVSLFMDSDNVAASIYWRPKHWSADGGTVYA